MTERGCVSYEDVVHMWQGFEIRTSARLEAYLSNFTVLFAYHSGAIENGQITYHDTREIFENGQVVNYTGDLKTLYEIENMKRASQLLLRWFDDGVPITQKSIREMHRVLTQGTYDERRWALGERPGEYKKNDIWGIGENEIAAPAAEVEHDIEEDLSQLKEVSDRDALTAAVWFHSRFEGIHAFADGNGRVGRAMMNYFLIQHNHPPVVIYQEDKQRYYNALDHFDRTGDIEPMKTFVKDQMVKTWAATYDRYERSRSLEAQGLSSRAGDAEKMSKKLWEQEAAGHDMSHDNSIR